MYFVSLLKYPLILLLNLLMYLPGICLGPVQFPDLNKLSCIFLAEGKTKAKHPKNNQVVKQLQ